MQRLTDLFTTYTGLPHQTLEALPTSGSNRRYFRITAGETSLIGVHGESRDENRAFITLATHFHKQGLNVPQVVAVSDDEIC